MNPDGQCLMEIDDFAPLEGVRWSSLWPQDHRPTLEAAVQSAAAGTVTRFSADCPTAKGTPKHWDVLVSPVYDRHGGLTNLLAVSRDVTRDVLVAGERALVARELSHRIANLFTVVDGIIGMSARATPVAQPFALALRARMAGLSRAISYVYSGGEGSTIGKAATFHGLLDGLLAPFGLKALGGAITISGDDLKISEAAVTAVALVFNELATNALKYGALTRPEGSIEVSTLLNGENYLIIWDEDGCATSKPEGRQGFGTTLLDRTVQIQLAGALKREWKPNGLRIEMTIPTVRLV